MSTLKDKVKAKLQPLQVGDSFNKAEFIKSVWGEDDYFTTRSFDVYYCLAKKEIRPKEFRVEKGMIRRTY